jgi:alpha-beta hydrolase superfamily lysophospholipase
MDFPGPQELRTRGTVLVVPGRGETHTTYRRLGTRLSADAYHVRIIDPARLTDELSAAAALPRPLVLLGADAGAAAVAALTPTLVRPDAVVLAGLPAHAAGVTGDWASELEVRTSCAVHRGVLTNDEAVQRGALETPLPDELLTAAYENVTDVPLLVLVGDEDPLADREALARVVKSSPRARLSVVHGAHHDVLNDRQHRSVAAEIVSFLETLGNELVPVIEVESSAW